jgi:hypothetical protein
MTLTKKALSSAMNANWSSLTTRAGLALGIDMFYRLGVSPWPH